MDDVRRVRRGEHVEQLVGEAERLDRVDRPALAALLERLALEQLHHQEGSAVLGRVDVEDRHRARVPEAIDGVRLLLEPRGEILVLGDVGGGGS